MKSIVKISSFLLIGATAVSWISYWISAPECSTDNNELLLFNITIPLALIAYGVLVFAYKQKLTKNKQKLSPNMVKLIAVTGIIAILIFPVSVLIENLRPPMCG